MSLQRRLLLCLLLAAPIAWAMALVFSAERAKLEVNELFDTEILRLARHVQTTLDDAAKSGPLPPPPRAGGLADPRDFVIAVWDADGRLLPIDLDGPRLPYRPDAAGFVELALDGEPWRAYYLRSQGGEWLVAAAQRKGERDELVGDLVTSQMLPWLLALPLLLAAMAWSVRWALAPLRGLTSELQGRDADSLQPMPAGPAPAELRPLLSAMNGLFARIESTRERERRFTADAAHELRTPLAVLRAQWDVLRRSADAGGRRQAEEKLGAGIDRMDRLVSQLLELSRLEGPERLAQTAQVDWPAIVEQSMSDVLALAERRHIELGCDWPDEGTPPFPLRGDAGLLAVLLRNLLDNAVRYGPPDSAVNVIFTADGLAVENEGAPLPAQTSARLGERFHRGGSQQESGSGLGISIVQRISALHGLELSYRTRADGSGVSARLRKP